MKGRGSGARSDGARPGRSLSLRVLAASPHERPGAESGGLGCVLLGVRASRVTGHGQDVNET